MFVKLLTGHHFEYLCLKGGCRGSSESTLFKISNIWKSHVTAQMSLPFMLQSVTVSQFPVSWHVICAGEGVPSYPTAQ